MSDPVPAVWSCPVDALGPGETAVFQLGRPDGRVVRGFIVNHRGEIRAYVNHCPHAGTPLDLWPNEFYTEDREHLICATHGAVFHPVTGVCVEGPCPGALLDWLIVRRDGDRLVVSCPP